MLNPINYEKTLKIIQANEILEELENFQKEIKEWEKISFPFKEKEDKIKSLFNLDTPSEQTKKIDNLLKTIQEKSEELKEIDTKINNLILQNPSNNALQKIKKISQQASIDTENVQNHIKKFKIINEEPQVKIINKEPQEHAPYPFPFNTLTELLQNPDINSQLFKK